MTRLERRILTLTIAAFALALASTGHQAKSASPNVEPAGAGAPAASSGCAQPALAGADKKARQLQSVAMVKEPRGALKLAMDEAVEQLQRCPTDEEAWYELVRGAEMYWELASVQLPEQSAAQFQLSIVVAGKKLTSLADATAQAIRVVPGSPRLALVDARVRPDTGRAAAFVARFPDFVPLRLELAHAELAAGDAGKAAQAFAAIKNPTSLPGAGATLSAIKLAQGDPKAALAALSRREVSSLEVTTAGSEAYERTLRIPRERAVARYRAELTLHRPAAALRPLLDAAEMGSPPARELLLKPDPALAKAISAARRARKLSAMDEEYLRP